MSSLKALMIKKTLKICENLCLRVTLKEFVPRECCSIVDSRMANRKIDFIFLHTFNRPFPQIT